MCLERLRYVKNSERTYICLPFYGYLKTWRVVQFASVSSCPRTSPVEAFQLQMIFMMPKADDLGMVFPPWYLTDCAVSSGLVLSEPYCSPGQCFHSCGHFLSNHLIMLLFVHPMSGNSFLNCLALYPFNWFNFKKIRMLSSLLQTMFTNSACTVCMCDRSCANDSADTVRSASTLLFWNSQGPWPKLPSRC